eukprot:8726276-Prorocentrum_lima.AAC.1
MSLGGHRLHCQGVGGGGCGPLSLHCGACWYWGGAFAQVMTPIGPKLGVKVQLVLVADREH